MFKVTIKKKVKKGLPKLPLLVQKKLAALLLDLRDKGPEQPNWSNYSKLGKGEYHCHLNYSWVACWRYYKNQIEIEVYYVGSRESAPY